MRAYVEDNHQIFGINYRYARRLIRAYSLCETLGEVHPPPPNEAICRSLANISSPGLRALVWNLMNGTQFSSVMSANLVHTLYQQLADVVSYVSNANVFLENTSVERYTPRFLLGLVREVLCDIDLDPASCSLANKDVQARTYYSQNGAQLSWIAQRVFCNPPYGVVRNENNQLVSQSGQFFSHGVNQVFTHGHCETAIFLLKAAPGYVWWNEVLGYPHCFLSEKLAFNQPNGEAFQHKLPHGHVVVCLTTNEEVLTKFCEVFSSVGYIPGYNSWAY